MSPRCQPDDSAEHPAQVVCCAENHASWTRRKFLKATAAAALSATAAPAWAATASSQTPSLFPTDLPGKQWVQFRALGFSGPVAAVIYRLNDTVTNGLALGGVDTGCLDFETSGLLGYCTIFNSHVPRRGPINLPLLGLAVGDKTWALCHPPGGGRIGELEELVHVPAWLPGDLGAEQPAWKSSTGEVPGWFKSLGRSQYRFAGGPNCVPYPDGAALDKSNHRWRPGRGGYLAGPQLPP